MRDTFNNVCILYEGFIHSKTTLHVLSWLLNGTNKLNNLASQEDNLHVADLQCTAHFPFSSLTRKYSQTTERQE